MGYLQDNERSGRILLPDLARAFALLGIVLVNVAYFAFPGEITYHAGGLQTAFDSAAYFGVNALFLFKSYTLFSFMFGVGLAYQMMSAERRNTNFKTSYFRRMLALIVLGILHVTLAFQGDILIFYGVLGALLYFFRNTSQRKLIYTGISLIVAINDSGNFLTIAINRWNDWLGMLLYLLPFQGPGIFAFFLLGLAGPRAGVLSNASAPLWTRSRKLYLPIGVILSLVGSGIYMGSGSPVSAQALFAYTILAIAAPLSSLGYIGLIAKWSEAPISRLKVFLARGGSASLTAYLLQSFILSVLFAGYGLGYFAELSALLCIVLALCVGIFTIAFASLWRMRFKQGPRDLAQPGALASTEHRYRSWRLFLTRLEDLS